MSDTQTVTDDSENIGPAPKILPFVEFAAMIEKTPNEIWTQILRSRYGKFAYTRAQLIDIVSKLGKEVV